MRFSEANDLRFANLSRGKAVKNYKNKLTEMRQLNYCVSFVYLFG